MVNSFFDLMSDVPVNMDLQAPFPGFDLNQPLANSFGASYPFALWQPLSPESYFGSSSSVSSSTTSPASSDTEEVDIHESDDETYSVDNPTPEEVLQRSCPTAHEEDRLCLNCWTAETPLWRRNDNGYFLCNACGLFLKTYGKNRIPPKERRVPAKKLKSQPVIETECTNCKTTETSLWRRGENNCVLCNACGLYWKIHGTDRPIKMVKKTGPRRRQRVWRAPGERVNPYSTAPPPKNTTPTVTPKSSVDRSTEDVSGVSTRPCTPVTKTEPASPMFALTPTLAPPSPPFSPIPTATAPMALPGAPLLFGGATSPPLPVFPTQLPGAPSALGSMTLPMVDSQALLAQQLLLTQYGGLPINNAALTAAATTQQLLTSAAMAFTLMSTMQPMGVQPFGVPGYGGLNMDIVKHAVEIFDSQVQALKEYTRQQSLFQQGM
eukprot:comp22510_c0_seq1/m.34105 comp22510_c0_seq1/g.34105  ORF comp22510_c0_seq1/g.34105 comp22510_c0_seq1/m.34105 type:complete len:436 (-) comp22510_c0_seq1:624-1931(-)